VFLIYATCQLLTYPITTNIQNISTSIFRNNTAMSGTGITGINLANGQTGGSGGEIIIPNDNDSNAYVALNTSLWSVSATNASNKSNGVTINMQAIDRNVSGTSYYAIRTTTDTSLLFGNIRISYIKLQ
jgi:hypothetical protein